MTEKEYRSISAISRSELFRLTESPEKFKWYQDHPEEPTTALLLGQLLHAMVLTPHLVDGLYACAPNVDRRTKAGKEAYQEFESKNSGKIVVPPDLYEQACAMCDSLLGNEYVRKLLKGDHEKPFFWVDELTGEECKCRVDALSIVGDSLVIVDIKTAESAETEAFTRAAIKYGYDLQAAMYAEGVKANGGIDPLFVFVVVEKKPPYSINILQADKLLVRRGYDLFRELIGIYHDCKETGNWYGYLGKFNQINNLALPAWLAKEVE